MGSYEKALSPEGPIIDMVFKIKFLNNGIPGPSGIEALAQEVQILMMEPGAEVQDRYPPPN